MRPWKLVPTEALIRAERVDSTLAIRQELEYRGYTRTPTGYAKEPTRESYADWVQAQRDDSLGWEG